MLAASDLVKAYERNTRIVEMQTDGLTHEQSLLQSEFNINCLNWTVGHIVHYRDELLEFLGAERLLEPENAERYSRESDPITADGPGVLPLDELVGLLVKTQDRLSEVLTAMEPADFAEIRTSGERANSVASTVHFGYFHDTYHAAHTDILRQLTGANDSLI